MDEALQLAVNWVLKKFVICLQIQKAVLTSHFHSWSKH